MWERGTIRKRKEKRNGKGEEGKERRELRGKEAVEIEGRKI